MEGSDREGAEGTEEIRVIFGSFAGSDSVHSPGVTAKGMHTADGRELVSLDDASDIVRIARFMRDYGGPGLDEEQGVEAMKGLAALLNPDQAVQENQAKAARDVLGSIASGTLSGTAPELRPAAVSLLKHFV